MICNHPKTLSLWPTPHIQSTQHASCVHIRVWSVYVLPLRAVAVHAAVSRLSAGLSVHGRPSPRVLHGHARLHAPLDAAAPGLAHLLTCRSFRRKDRELGLRQLDFCRRYFNQGCLSAIRHLMSCRPKTQNWTCIWIVYYTRQALDDDFSCHTFFISSTQGSNSDKPDNYRLRFINLQAIPCK